MRAFPIAVLTAIAACGEPPEQPPPVGGSDGPSGVTTVRFSYRAATSPRTDLPSWTRTCVDEVGRTHIHAGWQDFKLYALTAIGDDRWERTFGDVPVSGRQAIRISDGNVCDENPTGAATLNVYANDVLLTQIVDTPGNGVEPGLAFSVDLDGTVTP